MASGPLGGDEAREKKRRLGESNNVYSRKHQNKPKNPNHVHRQSSQTLAAAATTTTTSTSTTEDNDTSSHNRVQPVAQKVCDVLANGNGFPGYTQSSDGEWVRVRVSSRSKSEVRELKRKLVSELDQVRSLMKNLEAKGVHLSGRSLFSSNEVVDRVGSAKRVNSEVGSVGVSNSRPYRELSVSVMENSNRRIGEEFVEKEKRAPKANQKEKILPSGSNKKLKSSGGKKDGGGDMGFRVGTDWYSSQAFKSCSNLLGKFMKHKFGWVFNKPVDAKGLGLRDYYTIVKKPMDLGTVKTRLNNKNWYKSPREFAEDVRLTFRNAMLYNPKGQDVHFMAEQLLKIFEEQWPTTQAEFNPNRRVEMGHDAGLPTPTSRKTPSPAPVPVPAPAPACTPPPPPPPVEMRTLDRSESMTMPVDPKSKPASYGHLGRTPVPKKPKARDADKRDMTYEEKQRLSLNLQSLPSEKLENIVEIIRKRNLGPLQEDDEIEVDIASVDPETLWELDRFVTNYKKGLSKNKRKAELALHSEAQTGHVIQETNLAPAIAEAQKETEAVETNLTKFTPVQGEKQADNVSGSSSSSTDSRSSSSDSDSDSSSASGSDADH